MSNFSLLIQIISEIKNYPFLISIAPIIIASLIYFFGKIRSSNYWQYHLDNKYMPFLHGFVIINNFLFIPIVILVLLHNLSKIFSLVGLLLIVLFSIQSFLRKHFKTLVKWVSKSGRYDPKQKILSDMFKNLDKYLKLVFIKKIMPLIVYYISYLVLVLTSHKGILAIVLFIDFTCIMYFAHLDSILESKKKVSLILVNKKVEDVRIIEFLNNGALMKYQEDETNKVKVVPTSSIKEINMMS